MNDISNKTLAVLVIIAIIVSLVGLYLGRIRLVTVGKPTETGIVEANVQADVDITVTGPITFDPVYNNEIWSSESGDDCTATGSNLHATGCTNTLTPSDMLTVVVVGTTPADIGFYAGDALFTNKWDQTANVGDAEEDECYQVKIKVTDASITSQCNSGIDVTDLSWVDSIFMNTYISTTSVVAGIALYCETTDYFEMYAGIKIPGNEPTNLGTQTSTLTFVATSSI